MIENIVGSNFDDTIMGSAAVNELFGDGGNDTIDGLGGSDRIHAELGMTTSMAATEPTTVVYPGRAHSSSTWPPTSPRAPPYGQPETDTITSIENAVGTPGDDTMIGDDLTNSLTGGSGIDILNGGRGNDFLYGNEGADRFDGGFGNDLCEARAATPSSAARQA